MTYRTSGVSNSVSVSVGAIPITELFTKLFEKARDDYGFPVVFDDGGIGSFQWISNSFGTYMLNGAAGTGENSFQATFEWHSALNNYVRNFLGDAVDISACGVQDFPSNQYPDLSGFRIRIKQNLEKSPEFHTYKPWAAGTNGERVINLANLFDDESFKTADGWSMWSRELTFDDINFVNSNGGVTIVFNPQEIPNYWFNFVGISTLSQFFGLMINEGHQVQYIDNV